MVNKKKHRTPCIRCGKEPARPEYTYCSNACQQLFAFERRYVEWLKGAQPLRSSRHLIMYTIKRDGKHCDSCKLSEWLGRPIALELNHKDGNSENNLAENLHVLCPNCHAQTPNFRALNKGNGRAKRRERERTIAAENRNVVFLHRQTLPLLEPLNIKAIAST